MIFSLFHFAFKSSFVKLNFISLADIITPFILLGHGIGRIGCFLVGDDYGLPTNLPWAVSFPNGIPKTIISTFTIDRTLLLTLTENQSNKGINTNIENNLEIQVQPLPMKCIF